VVHLLVLLRQRLRRMPIRRGWGLGLVMDAAAAVEDFSAEVVAAVEVEVVVVVVVVVGSCTQLAVGVVVGSCTQLVAVVVVPPW